MKNAILLMVAVLVVGMVPVGAGAVIDPTPDLLGVYFDTAADSAELVTGPNIPFNMHFILTTPSASHILGYEFSYQMNVSAALEGAVFKLGHTFPPGITDLTMPVYDAISGEVIQSWPSPVPTTNAVILMTFQYMLLSPLTAHLSTGPASVETIPDGLPAYWDGTNAYALDNSGCSGAINDFCGVAVEQESFGAVKALYR